MSDAHPTDEQLAAALDGHDPGASAHAQDCAQCRDTLAAMRSVADALGVAPPVDTVARERHITAALDAATAAAVVTALPRRRWSWPPIGSALGAAAAILVVVLLIANVGGGHDRTARDTAAGVTSTTASNELAAGSTAGPATVDGGDLGSVEDGQQLAGRIGPALGVSMHGAGVAASGKAATTTTTGPAAPAADMAVATGPIPCVSAVAQDFAADLGPLVYTARATFQGRAVVVLAYRRAQPTGTLDYRVFVMDRSSCALVTAVSI